MKKIKQLILTILLAGIVSIASAGNINVYGTLSDTVAPPAPNVEITIEFEESVINAVNPVTTYTTTTDINGEFNYTFNISTSTAGWVSVYWINCHSDTVRYDISSLLDGYNNYSYNFSGRYCVPVNFDLVLKVGFVYTAPSSISATWDQGLTDNTMTIESNGYFYDTVDMSIFGPFVPVKVSYDNCYGNLVEVTSQYNYSSTSNFFNYSNTSYETYRIFSMNDLYYCGDSAKRLGFNLTQNYSLVNGQNTVTGPTVVEMMKIDTGSYNDTAYYSWDFGDGSAIHNGLNFTHNYSGTGPYNLCVSKTYHSKTDTSKIFKETYCDEISVDANGVLSGKTNGGFTIVMGDGSNGPTAINQLEKTVSFNLFPNPASNNFSINLNSKINENATINIYNTTGTLVKSNEITMTSGEQTLNIDIQDLNTGLYIVQLATDNGVVTKKLAIK